MKRSLLLSGLLVLSACATSQPPAAVSPDPSPKATALSSGILKNANCTKTSKFTLMVHGGFGFKPSQAQSALIQKVLGDGKELLESGHPGVDVVQFVIEEMEDSGLFNAGKGGTKTSLGTVELDAAIMDGRTLKAGAVASVSGIKNPIRLARAVKDQTRHVMIVGQGAMGFADELGMERVNAKYFAGQSYSPKTVHYGTVGAVALDRCGDLAAGTSTGGLYGKHPGRVGDSPIIGAGTFADNNTCAVSGTGEGEKFIRANAAARISAILQYTKRDLKSALRESLDLVAKLEGEGGIIAIDRNGNPASLTNRNMPMVSGFVRETGVTVLRDSSL